MLVRWPTHQWLFTEPRFRAKVSLVSLMHRMFANGGWRRITASLSLMIIGAFFIHMSVTDVREAFRFEPVRDTCAHWLEAPFDARWVTLSGCRLDLASGASRKWKGWSWLADGGVDHKSLELFIPLSAGDEREVPVRGVVATSDAQLLKLMDELTKLPVEQVDAFIEAHAQELKDKLMPAELTGYVEPVASIASRAALKTLVSPDAAVLEHNREPRRANAIFGVVLGLILFVVGVLRVVYGGVASIEE